MGSTCAGPDPLELTQWHQQGAALAEADDLGGHRLAVTVGPYEAHLADLRLQPGGLDDQADQVAHAPVAAGEVGAGERAGGAGEERAAHGDGSRRRATWWPAVACGWRGLMARAPRAAELRLNHLAGALQLGVDRCVDLALQRAHDRATAPDAAVGLDVAVLDAPDLSLHLGDRGADGLEVGGVDEHGRHGGGR